MSSNKQEYAGRFKRVLDYIDRHPSESLSTERLSSIAHFSKYHFHRQFAAYVGVSVGRYVQLSRLLHAAYRLVVNPHDRITDIATEVGFEHAESLTRAFRNTFGQSPSDFRATPNWAVRNELFEVVTSRRNPSTQVQITNTESVTVAALEHRGTPALLNTSMAKFMSWQQECDLSSSANNPLYGIAYNDPNTTPAEDFRFDICCAIDNPVPNNRFGIIAKVIPGGRCAVLRHNGSLDDLPASIYYLYGHWFPASGEKRRDFPVYFRYLNIGQNTPEHEPLTDIYLSLA